MSNLVKNTIIIFLVALLAFTLYAAGFYKSKISKLEGKIAYQENKIENLEFSAGAKDIKKDDLRVEISILKEENSKLKEQAIVSEMTLDYAKDIIRTLNYYTQEMHKIMDANGISYPEFVMPPPDIDVKSLQQNVTAVTSTKSQGIGER